MNNTRLLHCYTTNSTKKSRFCLLQAKERDCCELLFCWLLLDRVFILVLILGCFCLIIAAVSSSSWAISFGTGLGYSPNKISSPAASQRQIDAIAHLDAKNNEQELALVSDSSISLPASKSKNVLVVVWHSLVEKNTKENICKKHAIKAPTPMDLQ